MDTPHYIQSDSVLIDSIKRYPVCEYERYDYADWDSTGIGIPRLGDHVSRHLHLAPSRPRCPVAPAKSGPAPSPDILTSLSPKASVGIGVRYIASITELNRGDDRSQICR